MVEYISIVLSICAVLIACSNSYILVQILKLCDNDTPKVVDMDRVMYMSLHEPVEKKPGMP